MFALGLAVYPDTTTRNDLAIPTYLMYSWLAFIDDRALF